MDVKHGEDPHGGVFLPPWERHWCVSVVEKLAGPAGTPSCGILIPSTVSSVTWCRRILALLHTGIPWKHKHVL